MMTKMKHFWHFRLLGGASVALMLLLTSSILAQSILPEPSKEKSPENDRVVSCAVGLDDTYGGHDGSNGFWAVLGRAEQEQVALERKMRNGYYREAYKRSLLAATQGLVETVHINLKKLDATERTAAVIYSYGTLRVSDSYKTDPNVLCIWLVTTNGVSVHQTDLPEGHPSLAQFVQDGLGVTVRAAARAPTLRSGEGTAATANSSDAPTTTTNINDVLQRTSELVIPPELKTKLVNHEITRLLILAESDVGTIPFAALPIVENRSLIDFASIAILPDVGVLLTPQLREVRKLTGAKLIVGDPDFSADKIWNMPALPQAKEEAIEVAQRFGASVLLGKAATRTAVMARLSVSSMDLAYFATHGLADGVNPMDGSFLALTGQYLYGSDIKRLKLRGSPLIVMSACQSGLGKVFPGGVFGLARAWFFAGAPQVVMSLWNVADEPTKVLMVKFMDKVAERVPPELAMQQAMRETKPLFPDPVLWAGFAVYGKPTQF